MRKCNICGSNRPDKISLRYGIKQKIKKTCRSCERGWKGFYYRYLVQQRQLTLFQRTISIRIYVGMECFLI